MKSLFILFFVSVLTLSLKAQTASVDKSLWQVQTGPLGLWVNNELKLTNSIALHSEIGLAVGFSSGQDEIVYGTFPVFTVEPIWFYNLNKRTNKSKSIENNSGNYLGLKTTLRPDLILYSNDDNTEVQDNISVVPVWGMRRNLGKSFNFEFGGGIGYMYYFNDGNGAGDVAFEFITRVGYRF